MSTVYPIYIKAIENDDVKRVNCCQLLQRKCLANNVLHGHTLGGGDESGVAGESLWRDECDSEDVNYI